MKPYRLLIERGVADALRAVPRTQRLVINRWLDLLESAPHQDGEFQIQDERGRRL